MNIELGQTYDVWWEIVEIEPAKHGRSLFTLRNKANGKEVTLLQGQMELVASGQRSVSSYISQKITEGLQCSNKPKREAKKRFVFGSCLKGENK